MSEIKEGKKTYDPAVALVAFLSGAQVFYVELNDDGRWQMYEMSMGDKLEFFAATKRREFYVYES